MNRGNTALTLEKILQQDTSDKELYVSNCGYFIAENSAYSMNRSACLDGYLLIYLHKGRAKVSVQKGKSEIIEGGAVIIYKPYEHPDITYLSDPINERYYVYFGGTHAGEVLKKLKLDNKHCYNVRDLSSQIKNFHKIIKDFKIRDFGSELFRITYLLNILTAVSEVVNPPIQINEYPEVFKQILDTIEKNYFEKISPYDLANNFSISLSTLKRYFKKYTDQSPMEYINDTRINMAKIMLIDSNLQISDVAYSVGFEDALYFSKFFKKKTGLSPKAFRNKVCKNNP